MLSVQGIKKDSRVYLDRNDLLLCLQSIKEGKTSLEDTIEFLKDYCENEKEES